MGKHIAAPAVVNSLVRIPFAFGLRLDGVKKQRVMAPRQLCNNLLHKLLVGPSFGESPHVFQIPGRNTGHLRESATQIRC
jgi:hypothetical protein